jgi:succinate dehydrogenase / fumarate reductase cytochrome b subunit
MFRRLSLFARSSIGKKALMSLTGIGLILFLIAHVAGNLTLFADDSGAAFDAYSHTLRSNPLLPLAEIALAALFIAHIALGVRAALANWQARPVRYKQLAAHGDRTWSSISMLASGSLVLVFLVIHLFDFRLEAETGQELAPMVVARLSTPLGAAIYFVGVGAVGLHLWHAVQSLFQTLGLHHPSYRPWIQNGGRGLAAVLAVLFWLFPTFCLLQPGRWTFGAETTASQDAEPPHRAPAAHEPAEEQH